MLTHRDCRRGGVIPAAAIQVLAQRTDEPYAVNGVVVEQAPSQALANRSITEMSVVEPGRRAQSLPRAETARTADVQSPTARNSCKWVGAP
jgi:hypothetical protein